MIVPRHVILDSLTGIHSIEVDSSLDCNVECKSEEHKGQTLDVDESIHSFDSSHQLLHELHADEEDK